MTVCSHPEDGLRCRLGVKPPLKLKLYKSTLTRVFQNLMIQENTAGKDGQEYILRCTLVSNDIPRNRTIPPFDLPFLFYNGKF